MKSVRGRLVLDTLDEIADPKHTALLIIDLQNDNCSPVGLQSKSGQDISWARIILPAVGQVMAQARRLGLLVVFTRMTRSRDGSMESDPALRRSERAPHTAGLDAYCMEGTWGNEVLEELRPAPDEPQFVKYRNSAFAGTGLDRLLRDRAVQSAVVVGVVTEACVEATARDLYQHGYYPVVPRDCVASRRKDLHDASTLVMSSRFDVIESADLLRIWRAASPGGSPAEIPDSG